MSQRPNLNEANRLVDVEAAYRKVDGLPELARSELIATVATNAAFTAERAWEDAVELRATADRYLNRVMMKGRAADRGDNDPYAGFDIGYHVGEGFTEYPVDNHDRYRNGYGGSAERVLDLHLIRVLGTLGGTTLSRAARRNLNAGLAAGATQTDGNLEADKQLYEAVGHSGLEDKLVDFLRNTAIATALLAPRPESDPDHEIIENLFAGTHDEPDGVVLE